MIENFLCDDIAVDAFFDQRRWDRDVFDDKFAFQRRFIDNQRAQSHRRQQRKINRQRFERLGKVRDKRRCFADQCAASFAGDNSVEFKKF